MLQGNLYRASTYGILRNGFLEKIMSLTFLNEEVEELASKRSQIFVNVRSRGWLFEAKNLVYEA